MKYLVDVPPEWRHPFVAPVWHVLRQLHLHSPNKPGPLLVGDWHAGVGGRVGGIGPEGDGASPLPTQSNLLASNGVRSLMALDSAEATNLLMTWLGLRGSDSSNNATAPATWGHAIDVPE